MDIYTVDFSTIDQEVIVLNAAWGMIDDMLHHVNFCLSGGRDDANLRPQFGDDFAVVQYPAIGFFVSADSKKKQSLPFALAKPSKDAGTSNLLFSSTLSEPAQIFGLGRMLPRSPSHLQAAD